MLFEFDSLEDQKAKIKVIGVGGAGGNAINRMISSGLSYQLSKSKKQKISHLSTYYRVFFPNLTIVHYVFMVAPTWLIFSRIIKLRFNANF